ncbi:hypothetical protein KIW84_075842 [Lathyrus oleraceus]|uniref:Uncharacterized protein n=1 Tax=Pisum sativum TaxID=3888 RepID=A0A9D4VXI8_PEA|nr:hypothetical protein KIW84_075842 [Pisum sativum]
MGGFKRSTGRVGVVLELPFQRWFGLEFYQQGSHLQWFCYRFFVLKLEVLDLSRNQFQGHISQVGVVSDYDLSKAENK